MPAREEAPRMLSELPEVQWVSPARLDYEVERPTGPFQDGDTFIIERLLSRERPRLKEGEVWVRPLKVDTPEITGATKAAGLAAAQFTREWLEAAELRTEGRWPLVVQAIKKDVFGRLLCYIWARDTGEALHDAIIAAGHSERISALAQLKAASTE